MNAPLLHPTDLATAAFPSSVQETTGPAPAEVPTGPGAPGSETKSPSAFGGFMPFLLIGVVFWFLIIGPERKNRRKREAMLQALKKGDRVMTNGGLYGRVAEVRDDVVILDTGDVRLKFSRAAIQVILDGDDEK